MFRLVALLFALLLPLQFAWGVAAAYCGHETSGQAVQHFGHHAHEHHAESKKSAGGKLTIDSDCTACHATCSVVASDAPARLGAFAVTGRQAPSHLDAHASAPARAPDRPQWPRLA
ncbi:MAG: cobalt-zinc-cadmium resistance protein [Comamonadaceae bacterium]|jgi:hypothetical protein|nr:cobalt-zinc-cadmium resistance protein [Comamonadaceae bacterium]